MNDTPKRPLDPSDFEDDLYDDEFAFDENDPELDGAGLGPVPGPLDSPLDDPELGTEFEDTPENWGDFEDPGMPAPAAGPLPGTPGGQPVRKSFFMKNFNTIVIGIGALLGLGVVFTQMTGPAPVPLDDGSLSEMTAPETADGLPQPSPIAPAPGADPLAAADAAPDQDLTPMPDPGSAGPAPVTATADGLAPLDPGPDLGFDNVGVKEGPQDAAAPTAQLDDPMPPIEGATEVSKPVVELPDPIAFENQPIPTAPPPAELADAAPAPGTLRNPADPPQMAAPLAESPMAVTPPAAIPPAVAPEQEARISQLSADNEALSTRNRDLETQISGANAKIEELAAMLAAMEQKISALEKAPAPAASAPSTTPSTTSSPAPSRIAPPADDLDAALDEIAALEEPAPKAAPSAPAAEDILVPAKPTKRPDIVPEMKKKAEAAKPVPAAPAPRIETAPAAEAPRWVLRSAQNGRAVVSDRTTGDLRSIQIGDNLRGVGKIQSIAQVGGRWVVQGSQGQVRQ